MITKHPIRNKKMINYFFSSRKEYQHSWYLRNRDRILAIQKEKYYENHQETLRKKREYRLRAIPKQKEKERQHKVYLRDKTQILARVKKNSLKPEVKKRIKSYQQKYRNINKEELKEYFAKHNKGQIITKGILMAIKKLPRIKDLYYKKNRNGEEIGKKIGLNRKIIIAVLHKYNLPIKPQKPSPIKNILCSNGLRVRSNPERMIVEMLIKKRISFIYEPFIKYNKQKLFPDFYLPEKDLYIEYAGLMSMPKYKQQIENKQRIFKQMGKDVVIITKPEQINILERI